MIKGLLQGLVMLYGSFVARKIWGEEESKKHDGWKMGHVFLGLMWICAVVLAACTTIDNPYFIGSIAYIIAYPAFVFYQWKREMPAREAREAARLEAERNKEQD